MLPQIPLGAHVLGESAYDYCIHDSSCFVIILGHQGHLMLRFLDKNSKKLTRFSGCVINISVIETLICGIRPDYQRLASISYLIFMVVY